MRSNRVAVIALVLTFSSIACAGPVLPSPTSTDIPLMSLARTSSPRPGTPQPFPSGRTVCGPDTIPSTQDAAAVALRAQYGSFPGFSAAVSDGSTEYVVVDEATEGEWSRRLVNTGVQIWTKCVDPRLITAAQHTVERLTSMPGDFSSTGYDETLDAVLIQTNLDADLVRRSISADAPEVPFNESTLRIVYVDSGCRGVGLDATIAGSPTDPRIVWLRTDRNKELNLVWPPGWFARFNPQLEVIDSAGSVRYREGDPVSGGCVTADGSTLEIDGE